MRYITIIANILILLLLLATQAHAYENAEQMVVNAKRFYEQNNFPMALRHFTKSMERAEEEGNYHAYVVSIGYISNVYFNVGNYGRQAYYLQKGFAMAREHRDTAIICSYLSNLVLAYCRLGDVKSAKHYFAMCDNYSISNDNWQYYYIYNRARIATAENKIDEALIYHQKALAYARKKKMNIEYSLFQLCELATRYVEQGKYPKAIAYADSCLAPVKKINNLDLLTSVYCVLSDSYMMSGDSLTADHYRQLYRQLSDSLFNSQRLYSAANELMEYETRQTNEEINMRDRKITMQTIAISVVVILAVVLSLMLFAILRYNRRLRTAHRLLVEKNKELLRQEQNSKKLLEQWVNNNTGQPSACNTEVAQAATISEVAEDTGEQTAGVSLTKEQTNILLSKIISVMSNLTFIANPDFNLNMLADEVGSNTKYVSWVINVTYSKNFKTLLNEYRIREACKRLQDQENYGRITIQAIYEEVGYSNSVSFIRAFKKVNGMTPSEYQKAAQKE